MKSNIPNAPRTLSWILCLLLFLPFAAGQDSEPPNVLIILADDLGYTDVGSFGAELIKTPHIDRLVKEGMKFTRAYTPCSVCSPTRYSLLTGRYYWRSKQHPPTKVIQDGQGLAIELGRETLGTLFKKKGYTTGVIGKWHLGFGEFKDFDQYYDWTANHKIGPGPLDVGFDYYFGMAANVANQPKFFIENNDFYARQPGDRVTAEENEIPPGAQFMVTRKTIKAWDPSVYWTNESVAQTITDKAVEFIGKNSGPDKEPFFLYYAHNIPHGPVTPAEKYQGTSECGPYGDFVQELDAQVGEVLAAVDEARRYRDTLVIFTSDNGGVAKQADSDGPPSGPAGLAREMGHLQCGHMRGGKWSIYEGGFRVPFIVHWPSELQGGQASDKMISLVDIFSTMGDMLGVPYGRNHGEDSFSFWPQVAEGPEAPAARDHVIVQSPLGVRAIVRDGWKYIRPWTVPDAIAEDKKAFLAREVANPENHPQLYHLNNDFDESVNLLENFPSIASQLKSELIQAEKVNRTTR